MGLDGLFTYENFLADFLVGQSFCDEPQDFKFAFGKRVDAIVELGCGLARVTLSLSDFFKSLPRRHFLVDPNPAAMHVLNCLYESGRGDAFRNVTLRPTLGGV